MFQWDCNSGAPSQNELFNIVNLNGGLVEFKLPYDNLCVQAGGSGLTNEFYQEPCTGGTNQQFKLSQTPFSGAVKGLVKKSKPHLKKRKSVHLSMKD